MADFTRFEAALKAAADAGDVEGARTIALEMRRQMAREQPNIGMPEPVQLGQSGMPAAIRDVAKGSGVGEQRLAGIGAAPMVAGHAIANLAGADNDAAMQNWKSLAGATPNTMGGNMAGNAAMFGVAPAGAVGAGMGVAGKTLPRLGTVADVAATQGGLAAATTPGDGSERIWAGALGMAGGAAPAAVGAVQGGRRMVTKDGKQLGLAEALRREIGPDAENLTTSLEGRYPGELYGARGSAAMLTRNPTLEVLETGSRVRTPDQWTQFDRMNAAARWKALEDAAGTPQELAKLKAARDAITTPKRDDALKAGREVSELQERLKAERAAMVSALQDVGRFETTAAQMENRGDNFVPVPGMPRVSSKYSAFPERVSETQSAAADARKIYEARRANVNALEGELSSLSASGKKSFDEAAAPISGYIEQLGGGVNRPNKDVQTIVNYVQSELNKGVTPEQLYTIRKMLTDGIAAAPTSELSQAARAARPQRMEIIGKIDEALNDMSGGKWTEYLESYKISSPLITSRESLTKMRDRLSYGRPEGEIPASMGEKPAPYSFGRLLEQHGTKMYGSKEFDRLIPQHRELASTLLSDLNAQAGVMQPRATLGSPTAGNLANAGRVNQLTNSMLDAAGNVVPVVGGSVAASVKGGLQRMNEEALSELLKDPKRLAETLRKAKASAELLRRSGQVGAGGGAAARTGTE